MGAAKAPGRQDAKDISQSITIVVLHFEMQPSARHVNVLNRPKRLHTRASACWPLREPDTETVLAPWRPVVLAALIPEA